ncbi:50S ribosomal protein L18 [Sporomusa acidovorans]|uniref:Large ribosomal subunit protein uL18 n=1 Tax=Sporomusa acidovorans (strain ATCC 49682 / DSM 3132 / Mol) TaxID=1123286 RepID=A0ABZ3IX37_SPOA4|nr:50S ribosomal protein L18 [Sporomusa acidovorans]OZC13928.1 50S ribosomal protein L18 [Sporomusa acidovorans DSM 3132]SDF40628.1 large subunit ribosomal protein L18 [Sporomusa acidovorans]
MLRKPSKHIARHKRQLRARKNLIGSAERPRLNVFRSLKHIYAQIINDKTGVTLVSASTVDKELQAKVEYGGNIDAAKVVGEAIAKRALEKGITKVVFDRAGYIYHGRVAALAAAAREAGLEF